MRKEMNYEYKCPHCGSANTKVYRQSGQTRSVDIVCCKSCGKESIIT